MTIFVITTLKQNSQKEFKNKTLNIKNSRIIQKNYL